MLWITASVHVVRYFKNLMCCVRKLLTTHNYQPSTEEKVQYFNFLQVEHERSDRPSTEQSIQENIKRA